MSFEKKIKRNQTLDQEKAEAERDAVEKRDRFERKRAHLQKNNLSTCKFCDYLGMVTTVQKSSKNTYAFRCSNCEAADELGLSKKIPEWNSSLSQEYEILMF